MAIMRQPDVAVLSHKDAEKVCDATRDLLKLRGPGVFGPVMFLFNEYDRRHPETQRRYITKASL